MNHHMICLDHWRFVIHAIFEMIDFIVSFLFVNIIYVPSSGFFIPVFLSFVMMISPDVLMDRGEHTNRYGRTCECYVVKILRNINLCYAGPSESDDHDNVRVNCLSIAELT